MNLLDALSDAASGPPVSDILAAIGITVAPRPAVPPPIRPASALPLRAPQRPAVAVRPARPMVEETGPVAASRAELRAMVEAQCRADASREVWPDDWWDPVDPEDARRCRLLWAEVLRFCLGDVCQQVIKWAPRGDTSALLSWVRSRDCDIVAALAGVDPDALRDRVLVMLATAEGAAALLDRLFPWLGRGKGPDHG